MAGRFRAAWAALTVIVLAAGTAAAQTSSGTLKIAFLRSDDILQNAPGRDAIQAQLDKEVASYRAQVQRMGDSLDAMVADYSKQETTLSAPAKDSRQKLIQTKQQEYQLRTQQLQQTIREKERQLVQPIMDQINQVIETIRVEEGYTFVLDAQQGGIVAADRSLDITDKVLTRLKAMPAATAAKPGARPATPNAQPSGVARPRPPGR